MNSSEQIQQKVDVESIRSERGGMAGFIEGALRRFRVAGYLIALIPLYFVGILSMGISATPAVMFFKYVFLTAQDLPQILYYLILSCSLVISYFIYGLCLLFVVPLFNFLMPFRLRPFRGAYYSLETVPWYFHNAFTYIVRYTFLEFVTPTPLNMMFYRLMGMKIGKDAHINTTNISDPGLIEIGDKVTIGGSVHLIGHYASKGYLIVQGVKIHDRVTIGLKATIMGDVEIGEGASIGPHELILPKSRIPPGRKAFEIIKSTDKGEEQKSVQDFI